MITDLDRFKSINDAHGHDGGDDVLREFARRLRKNVRGIDLACRFGGEEFVVVMPDTEPHIAEKVAERIRAEIEKTPFADRPQRRRRSRSPSASACRRCCAGRTASPT